MALIARKLTLTREVTLKGGKIGKISGAGIGKNWAVGGIDIDAEANRARVRLVEPGGEKFDPKTGQIVRGADAKWATAWYPAVKNEVIGGKRLSGVPLLDRDGKKVIGTLVVGQLVYIECSGIGEKPGSYVKGKKTIHTINRILTQPQTPRLVANPKPKVKTVAKGKKTVAKKTVTRKVTRRVVSNSPVAEPAGEPVMA